MAGPQGLVKIPELRKKIIFTLIVLAVYRIGVHIPTPGVDGAALQQAFASMQGTIFGWFNLFSGGALERFSIFALGIMPYISSSIIFQLLTVMVPYLSDLQKEGDQGRKKITQYTRYGTVILCFIQGFAISSTLMAYSNPPIVLEPGLTFKILTTITLTGGTMFLVWLGEQISERGIGNGTSMIIFAGIAARIPEGISSAISLVRSGEMGVGKLAIVAALILSVFFIIIFVERASRRIPVNYAKRVVGRKIYGGQNTHIPLKLNTAGVIPPIFASSLLMFPATIGTFVAAGAIQTITSWLSPGGWLYEILFVGLIFFFAYFYTAIVFKTEDVAENLKKYGGFVPGIRPGENTVKYIDYVLTRVTLAGATYISLICVLPTIMSQTLKVPFYFGGTSVLILVGVALDTVAQIETFMLSRNYEGFMKHAKVKGRTGSAYS
jgi:preprotein translocase subunit SecY